MNLTKMILVKVMLVNQEMALLIFLKSGPFGFFPGILYTSAQYGNMDCQVFKRGVHTKLERVLPNPLFIFQFEKSSSTNWIFSLLQTVFLMPV